MRMARGFDPAAFDIVREEFRDRDMRDFRDRPMERELERPDRVEERDIPDAVMEVMNNDSIVLTPEMVEMINDPMLRVTRNGEITRRTGRDVIRRSGQFARSAILPDLPNTQTAKKRRKKSKYGQELGRQLKRLKKKHPRTPVIRLMKRAHRATKKALK
tara:strand:+ start:217 stop:693 length:477 start_codon:yes stop_codon:yes gene_type:complete